MLMTRMLGCSRGVPAGTYDSYFSNVTLLLHMNVVTTPTNVVDVKGHTITVAGSGSLTNSQFKFGNASYYAGVGGDYLQLPASSDFTLNTDYTIETWLYHTDTGPKSIFGSTNCMGLYREEFGNLIFGPSSSYGSFVRVQIDMNTYKGVWNHIAITRQGSTIRVFFNGVMQSTTITGTPGTDVANMSSGRIMSAPMIGQGTGFIDEFRITKGVARYVSNFTPQTAEFPNQ